MTSHSTGLPKPLYQLSSLHPRVGQEPCVALFFGKNGAIPSTQKASNNPMGYISHPHTLYRGNCCRWDDKLIRDSSAPTYWQTEFTEIQGLLGRVFSKFSFLEAKFHYLHPRRVPVNRSRRYCMKG